MKIHFFCADASVQLGIIVMEVDQHDIVRKVKKNIACLTRAPISHFRLLFSVGESKILMSESWPLSFYGVVEGAEIEIEVFRSQKIARRGTVAYLESLGFELGAPRLPDSLFHQAVSACSSNDLHSLRRILEDFSRDNPDEDDMARKTLKNKWGLLHFASHRGHSRIVQYLLSRNVLVNVVSLDEWTPLQLASYCGHESCVEALISHPSIQVNKRTKFRGTPLHLACEATHFNIVKILIGKNPSLHIEDQLGRLVVETTTNVEILEAIAVYSGDFELNKCRKLGQMPSDFCGEVYVSNQFFIHDRLVFLYMNVEKGTLESFQYREQYLDNKKPDKVIRLVDIQEVRKINGSKQHVFCIETLKHPLRYYSKFEEFTDEWIERIKEAVNFCIIYKPQNEPLKEQELPPENDYTEDDQEKELVNLSSFNIIENIGEGAFGTVKKVVKKTNEETYAMKILNKIALRKERQLKYAISECKIMKQLDHPFVVKMFFAFQTHKLLVLVLEYCSEGDLLGLIDNHGRLTEQLAKFYIAQVILAIEYIHSLDMVYRDLKPANILIASDGYIRLGDFGLAKENVTKVNPALTMAGTPAYLPPEIIAKKGASQASDVYGIGTVLYEMLVGSPPHYDCKMDNLLKSIENSKIKFPDYLSDSATDLLSSTMQKNPEKRPQISQIKRHSFFRKLDWDALLAKRVRSPLSKSFNAYLTPRVTEVISAFREPID